MKLYITISLLIYTILISLLIKNFSLASGAVYQLDWDIINNIWLYSFLALKFLFDISYILTKKDLIKRLSYLYIFILILSWFIFVPKTDVALNSPTLTLREVISLNHYFFRGYNKKHNKLPNKVFMELLKNKKLPLSPYLKNGKKMRYKLVISYGDRPVRDAEVPGNIFLVIDKERNDFIFTASIIDPTNEKVSMLFIGNNIFFIDKKLNMLQQTDSKEFLESFKAKYK